MYSFNSYLRGLFGYSNNGKGVDDNEQPQKTETHICKPTDENHQKRVQTQDKEETPDPTLTHRSKIPEEESNAGKLANNLQNSNSVNSLAFANKTAAKMLPKQNSRRRNSKRFVIGDENEEEPAVNHESDISLPVPNVEWLKSAARLRPGATLT